MNPLKKKHKNFVAIPEENIKLVNALFRRNNLGEATFRKQVIDSKTKRVWYYCIIYASEAFLEHLNNITTITSVKATASTKVDQILANLKWSKGIVTPIKPIKK